MSVHWVPDFLRVRNKQHTGIRVANVLGTVFTVGTPLLLLGLYTGKLSEWSASWTPLASLFADLQRTIDSLWFHVALRTDLQPWVYVLIPIGWMVSSWVMWRVFYVVVRVVLAPLPMPRPSSVLTTYVPTSAPSDIGDGNGVSWVEGPWITTLGNLYLKAAINRGASLSLPGPFGGGANVLLTDGATVLLGYVVPPPPNDDGWTWTDQPGHWVAKEYRYQGSLLEIEAAVSPEIYKVQGLGLCIWSGGGEFNRMLGSSTVKRL